VGIERTVVPLIGSGEFHIASTTLVVSFIISFGVIKAFANLFSGHLADVWGRKRVLILGWLFGVPVPFMIIWAPSWEWVIAVNTLLGINQGLAWSMTVIMKVDLVGPKSRGLAVGLNEFAGYFAVGITAFLTSYLATQYGLCPAPIYLGVGYAIAGAYSLCFSSGTRETTYAWKSATARTRPPQSAFGMSLRPPLSVIAISSRHLRPGLSTTSTMV
jgi:MFS family permease